MRKKIVLGTRAFGSAVCARSSPFKSSDFKRHEYKWKFVENASSLCERIAIFSTILAYIIGRAEALQVTQEDTMIESFKTISCFLCSLNFRELMNMQYNRGGNWS